MSKKTLFLLAVIAFIVLGLWYYSAPDQNQTSTLGHGGKLFPELLTNSAEIDTIVIRENTHGTLTFVRRNNTWVVDELDFFPANITRIRQLIQELANITLVEAKTSRLENFPLLGVEDVTNESGTGTEIRLMSGDETRFGLIIGRFEMPVGTYIRALGSEQSWLTDSRLIVTTDQREWLESQLVGLSRNDVQTIRFTPIEEEAFAVHREGLDKPYAITMADKNHTFQLKDQRAGEVLAELTQDLAPLRVSSVSIADELHKMAQTEFVSFDDTSVKFLSWKDSHGYYILYPPKQSRPALKSKVSTRWKVAVSETHFNRLNRQLTDVAIPTPVALEEK